MLNASKGYTMTEQIDKNWKAYINLSHYEQAKLLFKLNEKELRDLLGFFYMISGPSKYGELIDAAIQRITLALG